MACIRSRRHLATGVLGGVVAVALMWLAGSAWSMPDTPSGGVNPSAVIAHQSGMHGDGWGILRHSPGAQRLAVVHGGPLQGALAATAAIALLLVLLVGGLPHAQHPRWLRTVWLPATRGPPVVSA